MTSILPAPVAHFRQKASQKLRAKLRRILLLPPEPIWTHKEIPDDDDGDEEESSSSEDDEGRPATTTTNANTREKRGEEKKTKTSQSYRPRRRRHPPPRSPRHSYTLLHPTTCAHPFPVCHLSAAYRAYCHGGATPKLCPYCDIAAGPPPSSPSPSSSSSCFPVAPLKGATTVSATACRHPLTVRRSTAAIVREHPHMFSSKSGVPWAPTEAAQYAPEPFVQKGSTRVFQTNNNNNNNNDNDNNTTTAAAGVGEGSAGEQQQQQRQQQYHRPRHAARANLRVDLCVACLRQKWDQAARGARRARLVAAQVEREEGVLLREGGERVHLSDSAAWVRCLDGVALGFRRAANAVMIAISVLEAEAERAGMEEKEEGEAVDGVAGAIGGSVTRRRSGEMGSGWGSRESENSEGSGGVLGGLKEPTKTGGNEVIGKKEKNAAKRVRFDPGFQASEDTRRPSCKYKRSSTKYEPGRHAIENPLDTSGCSFKTLEEIRDWHNPKEDDESAQLAASPFAEGILVPNMFM